jgi:hypothetical protein
MAVWVVAALLVPLSLNQLDVVIGKLVHLYNAWRYR